MRPPAPGEGLEDTRRGGLGEKGIDVQLHQSDVHHLGALLISEDGWRRSNRGRNKVNAFAIGFLQCSPGVLCPLLSEHTLSEKVVSAHQEEVKKDATHFVVLVLWRGRVPFIELISDAFCEEATRSVFYIFKNLKRFL